MDAMVDSPYAQKSFGLVVPYFKYRVLDIACGRWHTIASVDAKDPLVSWGLNHRGQCGVKTYMPGAAFTPAYPKMIRSPSPIAMLGHVGMICAGPFTSGCTH